jgi:ribosomal protein S18 acetylase RimI-like enzyme
MIRLEPMDDAMYAEWRELTVAEYAREKVEAGNWPADGALELAERSFAELLTDGRATAGHELRSMVNDDGERVGYAWFVPEDRPIGRVAYIYDIAVEPAHRRRGYARQALAEIETFARDHGLVGVELNVFGDNAGARRLYLEAGYIETNVKMLKRVAR